MSGSSRSTELPAHDVVERPWRQKQRGGTREGRMLDRVVVRVPPAISELDLAPAPADMIAGEQALQAVARADGAAGPGAGALARFMIRTESIASSRIEHIDVGMDDLARAVAGSRAHAAALSMVAAAEAIHELHRRVGVSRQVELADILEVHRLLMRDDENAGDRYWAGRIREDQNWIGGSQYSPRDALYVPPPPESVGELLDDLLVFADRDDVPVGLQIAIAHAQFESIHPFTDGNGRIGRALIGAILQRRGVTRHAGVPVAGGSWLSERNTSRVWATTGTVVSGPSSASSPVPWRSRPRSRWSRSSGCGRCPRTGGERPRRGPARLGHRSTSGRPPRASDRDR